MLNISPCFSTKSLPFNMLDIETYGKEIPLFVSGENDNSFDENDYIEFWAERNYGSPDYREIVQERKDYKNYYDRYNDTNFVWLTWGGENGLRVNSISTVIPALTDSVKNHIVKEVKKGIIVSIPAIEH